MERILIAPVGEFMDDLFVALRETNAQRIILIADKERTAIAESTKKELEKFKVPVEIMLMKEGNPWEGTFEAINEAKHLYPNSIILINTSTGDRHTRCAATSAAFVNGFKAIAVDGERAMMLPILKFSYEKILTERKMKILNLLTKNDCCASFEELSKKTGMSLPLISYHINGNLKSEGLKSLGLVEVTSKKGKNSLSLTTLGRLLIKGLISSQNEKKDS